MPPKPKTAELSTADVCARLDRLTEIQLEQFKASQEILTHVRATARASIKTARIAELLMESFAAQVDADATEAEAAAAATKKPAANGAAATK